MNWIIGIGVGILIGYLLDREIYFYEGVHLGPRVQAWLYDRWSKKYDQDKQESQLRDDEMLAQPLLNAIQNISEPFVLDFATGTGRLSYVLTSRPEFKGHIIALDLSQGMLEKAVSKLDSRAAEGVSRPAYPGAGASSEGQESIAPPLPFGHDVSASNASVEFLRHLSLPLPFPDATFDAVCALEVLELFPDMNEPLAEFSRVLRPGGVFLSTRGTEESGRKAKVKNVVDYTSLLEKNGFDNVQVIKWWKLFDRTMAVKSGTSTPVGVHQLQGVLRCSNCKQIQWVKTPDVFQCANCGSQLSVTEEGIVLN